MSKRARRTIGKVLLFIALVTAIAIQFFGGGLLDLARAHQIGSNANGNSGTFSFSGGFTIHWLAFVPLLLAIAGLMCFSKRDNKRIVH
jgi:hypothetical protein